MAESTERDARDARDTDGVHDARAQRGHMEMPPNPRSEANIPPERRSIKEPTQGWGHDPGPDEGGGGTTPPTAQAQDTPTPDEGPNMSETHNTNGSTNDNLTSANAESIESTGSIRNSGIAGSPEGVGILEAGGNAGMAGAAETAESVGNPENIGSIEIAGMAESAGVAGSIGSTRSPEIAETVETAGSAPQAPRVPAAPQAPAEPADSKAACE